jgi:hypothetical protein
MTKRPTTIVWLVAGATLLLSVITAATSAAEPAPALKCNPTCLPPPEEEAPPEEEPQPTPGPKKHRVLVVNVGWGTGASPTDAPLQEGLLNAYVNHINGFVNEWFAGSAPPGTFPGWAAEAGGSYTIHQPNLPSPCTKDETDHFFTTTIQEAHRKLEQAGIDYSRYGLVLVVNSRPFCGNEGMQASNRAILANMVRTIHELGHFLGITEHAVGLRCKDASGQPVILSADCEVDQFGDRFDVMGVNNGNLPFNAIYARHLGWLSNDQYFDVRAPATGTWTIPPFIGSGFGKRAIRLQDGPTTLWIEFRLPIGIDGLPGTSLAGVGSGVFVRRQASGEYGPVSQLLDMSPENPLSVPVLRARETWANPLGEATITLDDWTYQGGATITIGNQRTATVPDLIGLDPNRAANLIAGAGLWSKGWHPVVDLTCNLVGVVATQQPLPGTKVFPDSEVRFGVGERDLTVPCQ